MDGAERILDVLGFDTACRGFEAVLTGEGRLDASSLEGQTLVGSPELQASRHCGGEQAHIDPSRASSRKGAEQGFQMRRSSTSAMTIAVGEVLPGQG